MITLLENTDHAQDVIHVHKEVQVVREEEISQGLLLDGDLTNQLLWAEIELWILV